MQQPPYQPYPSQQQIQPYPYQQTQPPQQPYALPETILCRREILGSYHAVELYQDGALWIIDQEEPPIEIKLDAQAAQRLRDFLMMPDEQHNPSQQSMNPASMKPVKQPTKRDNGDAIFWLLICWPVSAILTEKYCVPYNCG